MSSPAANRFLQRGRTLLVNDLRAELERQEVRPTRFRFRLLLCHAVFFSFVGGKTQVDGMFESTSQPRQVWFPCVFLLGGAQLTMRFLFRS